MTLYLLLTFSFSYFFIERPSAFAAMIGVGEVAFSLLQSSIFFLYSAVLMLAWVAAKRCGLRLNWLIYSSSAVIFLGAFPLAMLAIVIAEKNIRPDAIHAIKTGWLFPFMTVGLGIPFLAHHHSDKT